MEMLLQLDFQDYTRVTRGFKAPKCAIMEETLILTHAIDRDGDIIIAIEEI